MEHEDLGEDLCAIKDLAIERVIISREEAELLFDPKLATKRLYDGD